MYQIRLHREARKELEGLADVDYERISTGLNSVSMAVSFR